MKEKIEQLCDQIKDLLKKNDREYIIAIKPEVTYSTPGFAFPEYFNNIIDDSEYYCHDLLCDDSIDVELEDFVLDEDEEPVYTDDYYEDHDDEEDFDEGEYIIYYEFTQFLLIAIRIKSDELLFCVEETFTDDEQTTCQNVNEVSISSLVNYYDDMAVVRALEAYVRILSDTPKDSIFWEI